MGYPCNVFERTWNNDRNVAVRMEIIPVSNGVDLDDPSFPAVYHTIGEEVNFEFSSSAKTSYEKHPWGLPKSSTMNVKASLGALDDGTIESEELSKALNDPFGTWHSLNVGDGFPPITTSTVFRFFTNEGSGPPDKLFFQGAIRSRPPSQGDILNACTDNADLTIEFVLIDLVRLSLETVLPEHLARWIKSSKPHRGPNGILYRGIFRKNGLVHADVWAGHDSDPRFAWMWSLYDLYVGVFVLAEQVFRSYLRTSAVTFTNGGTLPFDHIRIYKRLYDGTTGRGTELYITQLYFLGAIDFDGGAGYDDAVEGILVDTGKGTDQQSLWRFTQIFDFLTVWLESVLTKAEYINLLGDSQSIRCVRPAIARRGYSVALVGTDIEGNANMRWAQPGRSIKGVKFAVPGLSGDDIADREIPSPTPGIEGEESKPLRCLFNNVPAYGEEERAYGRGRITDPTRGYEFEPIPDIPHDHIAIATAPPFPAWAIFYYDTPNDGAGNLTTGDVPILVHPDVDIDVGMGYVTYSTPFSEWPAYDGSETNNDPLANGWVSRMIDRLFIQQGSTCLPLAVATEGAKLFGRMKQSLFEGVLVDLTFINPQMLGERVIIGDGTANAFLNGRMFGSFLSTDCVIVGVEGDIEKGINKIDLLGI